MKIKTYSANSTQSFNLLPFNRAIIPQHVAKMVESITTPGIEVTRPVVCTKVDFIDGDRKMYIVDGQHLFQALIRLGWEIPVVFVTASNIEGLIEIIAKLNTTSKSWILDNYVDAWAVIDKKVDYRTLKKYREQYNLTYSTLISACCPDHLNDANLRMKQGKFRIKDKELTATLLSNIQDIFDIFPRGYKSEISVLVESYIQFFMSLKKYSHNQMLDAIRINNLELTSKLHNRPDCTQYLHDIYTAGTSKRDTRVAVAIKSGSLKKS